MRFPAILNPSHFGFELLTHHLIKLSPSFNASSRKASSQLIQRHPVDGLPLARIGEGVQLQILKTFKQGFIGFGRHAIKHRLVAIENRNGKPLARPATAPMEFLFNTETLTEAVV